MSSNAFWRHIGLPIVFVLLFILFGAAFIALLGFIVPLMMLSVVGGIYYVLVYAPAQERNKKTKSLQIAITHPLISLYLEEQNFHSSVYPEVAGVIGSYLHLDEDLGLDRSIIMDLVLSGKTESNYTLIQRVFPGMFHNFKDLEVLVLEGTDLISDPEHPMYFQSSIFDGLDNLQVLDLGKNVISELAENDFQNLPNLRILYLDQNPIISHPAISKLRENGVVVHTTPQSRTLGVTGGLLADDVISSMKTIIKRRTVNHEFRVAQILKYPSDKYGRLCGNCDMLYTHNIRYKVPSICEKCGYRLVENLGASISSFANSANSSQSNLSCINCHKPYDMAKVNDGQKFCEGCGATLKLPVNSSLVSNSNSLNSACNNCGKIYDVEVMKAGRKFCQGCGAILENTSSVQTSPVKKLE